MRRRRPHKLSRNTPRALHQADVNCVRAAADIANDGRRSVGGVGGSGGTVGGVKVERPDGQSSERKSGIKYSSAGESRSGRSGKDIKA